MEHLSKYDRQAKQIWRWSWIGGDMKSNLGKRERTERRKEKLHTQERKMQQKLIEIP